MKKAVCVTSVIALLIVAGFTVLTLVKSGKLFGAQNGTYNGVINSSSPSVNFDFSNTYPVDKNNYYNYSNLTDKQKSMYDKMYDAIVSLQIGDIALGNGTKRDAALAMYAVKHDNPQFFWFGYEYGLGQSEDDKIFIRFDDGKGKSEYLTTHSERLEMMDKLQKEVRSIFDSCVTDQMSQYEIELALHDWICANVEYDEKAGESAKSGERSGNDIAWTAYGALVERKAVCEGYSKAFQLLLYYAGINCNLICGETDGVAHMWNVVELDGKWYNVDVLWDDLERAEYGPTHAFFNVTNDFISKSHDFYTASSEISDDDVVFNATYNLNIPNCDYYDNNFYVVNDTMINSDDEYIEIVENAMKKAAKNDIDSVEFFYSYKEINENVISYDIKRYNVFSRVKEYYKGIKGIRYSANSYGSFIINVSR